MKRKSTPTDSPDRETFLGFTSSGSVAWDPGSVHQITTNLVQSLVRARDFHSPASICRLIRDSPCQDAFPCLNLWETLTSRDSWRLAPTSTSAEEAVKRQGRGPRGHWEDGLWLRKTPQHATSPPNTTMDSS